MKKIGIFLLLLFILPTLTKADTNLKFVGNGWEYKGCFLDVIDDDNVIEKPLKSDLYKRAKEIEQKYSNLKYWAEYIKWVPSSWCYGTDQAIENRYNKFLTIYYPKKAEEDASDESNNSKNKKTEPDNQSSESKDDNTKVNKKPKVNEKQKQESKTTSENQENNKTSPNQEEIIKKEDDTNKNEVENKPIQSTPIEQQNDKQFPSNKQKLIIPAIITISILLGIIIYKKKQ